MRITGNLTNASSPTFNDVKVGELFVYNDKLFVKCVYGNQSHYALNVETGTLHTMLPSAKVNPRDGEVRLT